MMSPGPGSYNANSNYVKDQTPNVNFSKSKRGDLISKYEKNKIGPGNYDVKKKKGGPSYTFGSKTKSNVKSDAPGPGNYDPNSNFVKDKTR